MPAKNAPPTEDLLELLCHAREVLARSEETVKQTQEAIDKSQAILDKKSREHREKAAK